MAKQILIADDDAAVVAALTLLLEDEGYDTRSAGSVEQIQVLVERNHFDLVLIDMNYHLDTTSGQEGLDVIERIRRKDGQVPIVVMTGWGSVALSVAAMQMGAGDFIEKPWDNDRLLSIVRNQIRLAEESARVHRLDSENALLRQRLGEDGQGFLVADPASLALLDEADRLAASDISVVLYGENGTGKSLLARHIHHRSHRHQGPFIAVNMGAIPENLFESEMFGHVKGAFTDARQDRIGRFELAAGGTLFLDEIANIPLSQQAKLLRVLESAEFERVGSNRTLRADVRVISATNADLQDLCEQGLFRLDLLYRLSGIGLTLPALRLRPADIVPLAQRQLERAMARYNRHGLQLADVAVQALSAYDWPGNVRELQHCIERAVLLARTDLIGPDDLRLVTAAALAPIAEAAVDRADLTLDEMEKHLISERLRKYQGQATAVARSLGLSRSALYRRLEKYRLETKG